MANRSQEENIDLLLSALRLAGARGLSIDQAKDILFRGDSNAGSRTKKILERLKARGAVKSQLGTVGMMYIINPGH